MLVSKERKSIVANSIRLEERVLTATSNEKRVVENAMTSLKNAESSASLLKNVKEANEPFCFRNVVKDTTFKLNNLVADATQKLTNRMRMSFKKLTKLSRKAAVVSTVSASLLLGTTTNLFSQQTFYIVGNVTNPANQMTWDAFVTQTSTAGKTYILTDDVGTPSSTIRKMPVDIIKSF